MMQSLGDSICLGDLDSMQQDTLKDALVHLFSSTFGRPPGVWAHSPGRVEVIGNHTDYNGGTVVGAAIDKGIHVAAALCDDGQIRLHSAQMPDTIVETSMTSYRDDDLPAWTAYLLGVVDEFRMRGWMDEATGVDLAVSSTLPIGTGLSSSAAIELATGGALAQALFDPDRHPGRPALVDVAHRAENRYVGMPCGRLDQSVVAYGVQDQLVVLDAATDRHTLVPLPKGHAFVLFRSHVSHQLTDSPYEARHRECRAALMALERMIPGIQHLAHCHPSDLDAYGVVLEEHVARRAGHVIHEQRRVGQFLRALHEGRPDEAGEFMRKSHESSRSLFENSTPELDTLVQLLISQKYVRGARRAGGGWGGAVIAWGESSYSDAQGEQICDAYEELFEVRPHWWRTGASDGLKAGSF